MGCVGKNPEPSEKQLQLTKSLKENSIHPEQEKNKGKCSFIQKKRAITANSTKTKVIIL